jgi:hypothetical protein
MGNFNDFRLGILCISFGIGIKYGPSIGIITFGGLLILYLLFT